MAREVELLVLPVETAADRAQLRRMVDIIDRRERRAARLILLACLALVMVALVGLHSAFPEWFPRPSHRVSNPASCTTDAKPAVQPATWPTR